MQDQDKNVKESSLRQSPDATSGQESKKLEDQGHAAAPFVYLMNKAKYESMLETGVNDEGESTSYMRLPQQFSVFNKATVFPFETVPNVFKINPPDQEDSD